MLNYRFENLETRKFLNNMITKRKDHENFESFI